MSNPSSECSGINRNFRKRTTLTTFSAIDVSKRIQECCASIEFGTLKICGRDAALGRSGIQIVNFKNIEICVVRIICSSRTIDS